MTGTTVRAPKALRMHLEQIDKRLRHDRQRDEAEAARRRERERAQRAADLEGLERVGAEVALRQARA